eukprot:15335936-Ditylum_brightwellii.AAC.1
MELCAKHVVGSYVGRGGQQMKRIEAQLPTIAESILYLRVKTSVAHSRWKPLGYYWQYLYLHRAVDSSLATIYWRR